MRACAADKGGGRKVENQLFETQVGCETCLIIVVWGGGGGGEGWPGKQMKSVNNLHSEETKRLLSALISST